MRHLSMEEFKLELEQLSSKGMKFDVKSQGSGNIYLSICPSLLEKQRIGHLRY